MGYNGHMVNWKMVGHEWAVALLTHQITIGNLRHAYLITGPQGVGRRTLALRLAQAINCPQAPAPGEACQVCQTCRRIERMQHPDLAVVQAEQVGATLKVDQIRELQHSLALAPYEARYRVALLLRFEEAHPSAANALLKTLEEPAPQVVLILTAESPERLLPTIVSRCEVLRLRPVPFEVVAEGLRSERELEPQQAYLLAHLSNGRPGYAFYLSEDIEAQTRRQAWLADHQRLLGASLIERFAYARHLAAGNDSIRELLQVWLSLWRDVLLQAVKSSAPLTNLDQLAVIERLSTRLPPQTVHQVIASLSQTLSLLDLNVNARLAVEVLMLNLPEL